MQINLGGNTLTEGYFDGILDSLNIMGTDGEETYYGNGEGGYLASFQHLTDAQNFAENYQLSNTGVSSNPMIDWSGTVNNDAGLSFDSDLNAYCEESVFIGSSGLSSSMGAMLNFDQTYTFANVVNKVNLLSGYSEGAFGIGIGGSSNFNFFSASGGNYRWYESSTTESSGTLVMALTSSGGLELLQGLVDSGLVSVNPNGRQLIESNGSTVAVDWSGTQNNSAGLSFDNGANAYISKRLYFTGGGSSQDYFGQSQSGQITFYCNSTDDNTPLQFALEDNGNSGNQVYFWAYPDSYCGMGLGSGNTYFKIQAPQCQCPPIIDEGGLVSIDPASGYQLFNQNVSSDPMIDWSGTVNNDAGLSFDSSNNAYFSKGVYVNPAGSTSYIHLDPFGNPFECGTYDGSTYTPIGQFTFASSGFLPGGDSGEFVMKAAQTGQGFLIQVNGNDNAGGFDYNSNFYIAGKINDQSAATSIDQNNRYLYDPSSNLLVDWSGGGENDSAAMSFDPFSRVFLEFTASDGCLQINNSSLSSATILGARSTGCFLQYNGVPTFRIEQSGGFLGVGAMGSLIFGNTTTPSSPTDGQMYYDGSNIKVYLGGAWKTITVS